MSDDHPFNKRMNSGPSIAQDATIGVKFSQNIHIYPGAFKALGIDPEEAKEHLEDTPYGKAIVIRKDS